MVFWNLSVYWLYFTLTFSYIRLLYTYSLCLLYLFVSGSSEYIYRTVELSQTDVFWIMIVPPTSTVMIRKMPNSVSFACFVYKIKMIMSGPRWLERLSKLLWQPVDEHRRFPFFFPVTVTTVHSLYFLNNFFLNFRNQMIQTLYTIIQTENKIWKGKFSLLFTSFTVLTQN